MSETSPASPIDYAWLPIETLRVGALGTENGLGLAHQKDAVFLQASTSEIYGDPLVHPQREDYWGNVNPIGPRSCYDEAKRYAEAIVEAYRRVHQRCLAAPGLPGRARLARGARAAGAAQIPRPVRARHVPAQVRRPRCPWRAAAGPGETALRRGPDASRGGAAARLPRPAVARGWMGTPSRSASGPRAWRGSPPRCGRWRRTTSRTRGSGSSSRMGGSSRRTRWITTRRMISSAARTWPGTWWAPPWSWSYLAFQLGHHTLAASSLEGLVPEESARLRRAAERYAMLPRGAYFA